MNPKQYGDAEQQVKALAQEWTAAEQRGDTAYLDDALTLDEVRVRVYADAAILLGRETQAATYQGQSIPGQFRTTLVWVRQDEGWRLAGLQLSPIMPPPAPQSR